MRLDDKISISKLITGFDDELNPTCEQKWIEIGKCCITPNSSAQKVKGADGQEYVYSYLILLRRPKDKALIPREGDMVHITKKDGTIDKDCRVTGFVTLRNWIKLWL